MELIKSGLFAMSLALFFAVAYHAGHCHAASPSESRGRLASLMCEADRAYAEGRFHDAIGLYTAALRLKPSDSSVFFGRAMAFEMTGNTPRALQDYWKALDCDPQNYKAIENIAGVYEREGKRIEEAIELYRRALKLDPRPEWKENLVVWIEMLRSRNFGAAPSAVHLWNRGNAAAAGGRTDEAEDCYSKAIALNSKMYQAYFSRGMLRLKKGNLRAAITDFDTGLTIAPRFPGGLVQRGLAWEQSGQLGKAMDDFRHAVSLQPRDPEARFHLGRCYERTGRMDEAVACYCKALDLKPKPDLRSELNDRLTSPPMRATARKYMEKSASRRGAKLW